MLPIELTHSALGGLVGARRPTVTLALSELTERGAIVRQRDGWLLLEEPKAPGAAASEAVGEPRPLTAPPPVWKERVTLGLDQQSAADEIAREELRETVRRLRAEHVERVRQMQERLSEVATSRQQVVAVRQQIRQQLPPRQPAPS